MDDNCLKLHLELYAYNNKKNTYKKNRMVSKIEDVEGSVDSDDTL